MITDHVLLQEVICLEHISCCQVLTFLRLSLMSLNITLSSLKVSFILHSSSNHLVNCRNIKWSWNRSCEIFWIELFCIILFLMQFIVSLQHEIVTFCMQFFLFFLKVLASLNSYRCWFANPVSQSALNKKLKSNPWQLQWELKSMLYCRDCQEWK